MLTNEGYVQTPDGLRLFFRQIGAGPAVFLPNGFHLFDDFQHLADHRTLIFYDVRHRGHSDRIAGAAAGIPQDAEDLETLRRHFALDAVEVIAHSYTGLIAVVHATKYPAHSKRLVLIGPMQHDLAKQYPAHLTGNDATLTAVLGQLAMLRNEPRLPDPQAQCEKFWSILRPVYVVDPANASRVHWGRCELPNERNAMQYWGESVLPSIQKLQFSRESLAAAQADTLIVHGTRDRSSPYGGGRDWAMMLPNARLVTIENAAHAPWIENPPAVFEAIKEFLSGRWPESAKKVESLEP